MKKILAIVIAIALISASLLSVNAATISELEARQAELEAQQAEYQQKLNDSNAAVDEQQQEVDALVGQVESVTEEIQVCYQKIAIYDESIAEKQTAIDAANAEIEANMDVLRQRIKTIYISGDVSALEIVLGAKDFSDFLDKLQLVQYVSNHDEELISGIKEQLDAISDEKAALEEDKAELEAEQATLTEKQTELNTLLEDNKETLAGLQSAAADAEMQLSLSEEELSGLSEEIQAYYRQQREALAALAHELGIADAVRFTGRVSREKCAELYAACGAFVLASRVETFGLVLAEAMACGRPIIMTDTGARRDLVTGETGIAVDIDDAGALSRAMTEIAQDPFRFDPGKIRAYCAGRFSGPAVCRELTNIYEEILGRS